MSSISEPHNGCHSDTNAKPKLLAHIDIIGMLNNIFGINKQGCIENDNNSNAFNMGDPIIGQYAEFDDEHDSNDVLHEC